MVQHVIANSAMELVLNELEAVQKDIKQISESNEKIANNNSHFNQSFECKQKTIQSG